MLACVNIICNPKFAPGTAAPQHLEQITAFHHMIPAAVRRHLQVCPSNSESTSAPSSHGPTNASFGLFTDAAGLSSELQRSGSERVVTSLPPLQGQETNSLWLRSSRFPLSLSRWQIISAHESVVLVAVSTPSLHARQLKQNLFFGHQNKLWHSSQCRDGKVKRAS